MEPKHKRAIVIAGSILGLIFSAAVYRIGPPRTLTFAINELIDSLHKINAMGAADELLKWKIARQDKVVDRQIKLNIDAPEVGEVCALLLLPNAVAEFARKVSNAHPAPDLPEDIGMVADKLDAHIKELKDAQIAVAAGEERPVAKYMIRQAYNDAYVAGLVKDRDCLHKDVLGTTYVNLRGQKLPDVKNIIDEIEKALETLSAKYEIPLDIEREVLNRARNWVQEAEKRSKSPHSSALERPVWELDIGISSPTVGRFSP